MFFQIGTQMKKMAEYISFLVHAQKFSRNMYPAKNLERDYKEIKVKKQVFKIKV